MKKSFKSTLAVAILVASATIGYISYNQQQNQQLAFANPLIEENIEALADNGGDDNSGGYEWVEERITNDCVYSLKLDGDGKVKISIGGKDVVTLSGDADATIEYTMPSAEVICKGLEKKNVKCKPSECPAVFILSN